MLQWLTGDCRDILPTLPAQSVHCVVTSPPYWGLRDYGNGAAGIGLESTLADYLANLADVFAAVWRVLRDDGTLWLNMGDAYNSLASGHRGSSYLQGGHPHSQRKKIYEQMLKPKDLIGQPWRVAFMLQDAGWYLRSDIIWHKLNPMPESVQDRPTKSHEYVFLLTKQPRYFYDGEAIREKDIGAHASGQLERKYRQDYGGPPGKHRRQAHAVPWEAVGTGRNKRTVWTIPTQPYSAAHFATFPPALARTCIQAGTSLHGCCAACGAPWRRVVEKQGFVQQRWAPGEDQYHTQANGTHGKTSSFTTGMVSVKSTTAWQPGCPCDAGVIPCTVLDPFGGAGTTALEADRLGRHAISLELNPQYSAMGQSRVYDEAPLLHAQKNGHEAHVSGKGITDADV